MCVKYKQKSIKLSISTTAAFITRLISPIHMYDLKLSIWSAPLKSASNSLANIRRPHREEAEPSSGHQARRCARAAVRAALDHCSDLQCKGMYGLYNPSDRSPQHDAK